MSPLLLRLTVYAHYVNAVFLALVLNVPLPYPRGPLIVCAAVSLAGTLAAHAYVAATGRWRAAVYFLFALDQVTTLPAVAVTGMVTSPFMIILPFALFSVYYIEYDIRLTIRYGIGCMAGFTLVFLGWWGHHAGATLWEPGMFQGFAVALFVLQLTVLGSLVYQSAFLPNPIVEEVARQEVELERQGRRAELGTALAQVSHEIRNPLSTITLSLDLLAEGLTAMPAGAVRDRVARQLKTSLGEVDRVNLMLESVLAYARERRGSYHFGATPVRPMLDRAIEFVRMKYGRHRIAFEVVFGLLDADELRCDPDAMHQVLVNLLDNAIQHRHPARDLRIEFRLHDRNGRFALTVRDNGTGIAAARLPNLFEKFRTGRPGGTGLGLSVVRHILQDHGGEVEAHSTEGVGTTFSLYLPSGLPVPVPAQESTAGTVIQSPPPSQVPGGRQTEPRL